MPVHDTDPNVWEYIREHDRVYFMTRGNRKCRDLLGSVRPVLGAAFRGSTRRDNRVPSSFKVLS